MKEYGTESIRNVALASHSGSGKTILGEAMLFATGAITRMGEVSEGNTVSDFEEEEIRRNLSLSTAILPVEFNDHKINILDTPGYTDFIGEVISTLSVADSAVLLIDSVAGIEVGTELVWNYCDEFNLPRFMMISKMDRENANFSAVLNSLSTLSREVTFIPVQLPWGEKHDFKGVIDLFTMKAREGDGAASVDIPDEYADQAEEARIALVEAAAEGDDSLLEKYLEGEELSSAEIARGFQSAVKNGTFVPVFISSACDATGVVPFMEALIDLVPSPSKAEPKKAEGAQGEELLENQDSGPLAAYVWKTTADPFVGKLTYMRIFSGVLSSDTRVWNHSRDEEERLGSLYVMRGKEQISVETLHAGDIGTVAKLGETATGDTLGDKGHPIQVANPDYPNALYSVAVTPKTQADSTKISPTLTRLCD
ncbi:MAG: GTP-binding protein, partial [Anaerolineales bacterium]